MSISKSMMRVSGVVILLASAGVASSAPDKGAYYCPDHIYFTCTAIPNSHYTSCKIKGINGVWWFAAPDKPLKGRSFFAPANPLSKHISQSILPPGKYIANYGLSYYGPITNLNGDAGYCLYALQNVVALAGLYSQQLDKSTGHWQKAESGYACQPADQCAFSRH